MAGRDLESCRKHLKSPPGVASKQQGYRKEKEPELLRDCYFTSIICKFAACLGDTSASVIGGTFGAFAVFQVREFIVVKAVVWAKVQVVPEHG